MYQLFNIEEGRSSNVFGFTLAISSPHEGGYKFSCMTLELEFLQQYCSMIASIHVVVVMDIHLGGSTISQGLFCIHNQTNNSRSNFMVAVFHERKNSARSA